MCKRVAVVILCLALGIGLCGCWNYRGLDELELVVGMSVDYKKETNDFSVGYEVADLSGGGSKGTTKGRIVHSQGKTLFDAARNAKRHESDRLFFGSAGVLIISKELVEERDLLTITEWFLRDGECRETMSVAISQEETAQVILQSPKEMQDIMSMTLQDIMKEDQKITASTVNTKLYDIYNRLNSPRKCVILPALHRVENGEQVVSGVNGVAIIKKEEGLVGFLTPEQSKYVLFIEDEIKGGVINFSLKGGEEDDTTLEIFESNTKKSFTYEQGKLTFHIHTRTRVAVDENQSMVDMMDLAQVQQVREAAQREIENNIKGLIAVVQREYNADIFGFGEMIYHKKQDLWKELEPDWDSLFPNLEVEVSSEVQIVGSGFIK